MTADNLLMQMVADVLDIPVVRPMMAETVALGAGYAAGLAVGYWSDPQVLRGHWQRAGEWRPKIDPARRDRELSEWRAAVVVGAPGESAARRRPVQLIAPRDDGAQSQRASTVPSGGIEPPASPKLDCRVRSALAVCR